MLDAFTAGAARAIARAEEVARRRGAAVVGPLDLLAALALETESRAAELMATHGVRQGPFWQALGMEAPGPSDGPESDVEAEARSHPLPPSASLPQDPELKQVLSESIAQARGLARRREVGTEHLLMGLTVASGPAAERLRAAGLDIVALSGRMTEETAVEGGSLPMLEGIPPLDLGEPGGGGDVARILDASANRAREGLRVVEDYARFALDDPGLTRRIKEARHRLAEAERGLEAVRPTAARDTSQDVGTHIMTVSERVRENPRAVLAANFKRAAEALRSLEEYSKLIDVWLAGRFEVLRYDVYVIEKMMMTAVASARSLGEARIMVLVGGLPTLGEVLWVVEEAIAGGADVVQYREKGLSDREWLRRAREVRIVTAKARVPLILNDRVDLARLAGCDGAHLGQDDLGVRDARRILGATAHIGVSTHDRAQIEAAVLAGASYLGVGPVFASPTKEFSETELAGLAFVQAAAESTALPWFAIGGIGEENLEQALAAGAERIAVSSAVVRAPSPRRAVARLKARMNGLDPDDLPSRERGGA